MKIRRSLLKDTVTVQTLSGESAYAGPTHADPVQVRVRVDAKRRLVRSTAGDETVSEATLYAHPDDAATFTPESLVTWQDHDSQVLDAKTHTDHRGRPTHVEVTVA